VRIDADSSRVSLVATVDDEAERRDIAPATSKIADSKIESTASLEGDVVDVEPVATKVAAPRAFTYYDTHIVPFLRKHCTSCHGKKRQKGELSFEEWADEKASVADRKSWEVVAQKLRKKEMPPPSKRQPEPAESAAIIAWIEAEVLKIDLDGKRDPGRVTMRRLNNYEYNYTIRDLTGLDLKLADDFPADDIGYGFDNIADVLSIPPLLMEKYLRAARKVARAVMEDEEARARVMICSPKKKSEVRSCAKKILRKFGERAYRRPLKTTESARLTKLVDLAIKRGDDFEKGIELGLQALLASPYFLFRVELDSRPNDPKAIRPVTDWELASRLSYFLWSSVPDEDLFDVARSRRLSNSRVLEKQVERMIQDSRSRGLVKTFSAMWLGSRAMKIVTPDPETYPDFDESLRRAMRMETELFFQEIMHKDLSVLLFLDSDFTFLNERIAKHYGIGGVRGSEFRRVTLQPGRRGGVLTQGSVLTVTSNPTRTSPVKRGKWVLEQILGAPPPPPPPGADSFSEETAAAVNLTMHQKMAQHRRDPNCAVCHQKMDALGLALENYDGVGAWRERDAGVKIDPSGTLPGGRSFRNPAQLKKLLLEQKEDFCRCLTEKMLTFALGRGLEYADTPAVETIVRSLEKSGYRFSALVLGIVQSEPFRKRRGERMTP
jgi:mono/diheme cytochrome c family protein